MPEPRVGYPTTLSSQALAPFVREPDRTEMQVRVRPFTIRRKTQKLKRSSRLLYSDHGS